jgi:tetratricopeptide (TPR) repeat protein
LTDTQLVTGQLFHEGQLARINGDYDTAISLLQRAIDVEPSFADAHVELGLVLCYTGDFDASLRELMLAVEVAPQHAEAHLQLAKIYSMLGMYPESIAMFRTVLSLTSAQDKLHEEALKQLSYFRDLAIDEPTDAFECDL